jgi:nitrogen fixation/metabolism regulation signal transduction histidine kinase
MARRPLARRVLASFAVVVIAFAATVGAGLTAQRQAARDVADLSVGYLPLETALARARAAQWTVAARLDRLLDDPRAAGTTREWLQTVARGRPAVLAEARAAAVGKLGESSDEGTRAFGRDVARELDDIEKALSDAGKMLPDLFGAIEAGDKLRAEGLLRALSARERGVAERLDVLASRIGDRRNALVAASGARDRRAMAASVALALLSLIVAAVATRAVNRRLAPLGVLTERAQAIAAGDRSPLPADLVDGPRDEIRELAVAFGAMVEGVATRDADLLRLRRRQEDIVNHLRAAVVALRADGVVEAGNPAARAILGVGEGDDLANVTPPLWALVKNDVAHAIERGVEPAVRSGVALGKSVLDVRVVSMQSGEGRLALLVADDVSEAADARARALQAERLAAIGKMAAHITHEIRNPLSSMQLNVELLEETLGGATNAPEWASAEAKRLLTAIVREVGRLADVSEEYLRVARLPSPRPALVDLGALVNDVGAFARPELERARVTLDLKLPGTPVMVPVDEAQVRQALVNLVRNAREAMEDGGRLTLALSSSERAAVLDVVDEGPGIPEDVRARIFDPFFTTKATGTGLGLPLTKQIVEAHGGTIACEAAEPHGTRFRLIFPQAVERSAREGVVLQNART